MKNKTLAWILGGAFVIAGAGLVACSSTTTTPGGDPPRPDSGTANDKDATTNDKDTGTASDTGTTPVGDAGAPDCGDPARNPRLRPSPEAGVFCPFQARVNDASAPPCSTGEHCCINAQNDNLPSTCNPAATACERLDAGATDWHCTEDVDCTGGQVCCFAGEPVVATDCPGKNFARGAKGTTCRAACEAGEYKVCSKTDSTDCPSGKTCTPFASKSIDMGACL